MDAASLARDAAGSATPDAVAGVVLAQVPLLGAEAGAALFDRVAARFPSATWCAFLLDGEIDRWPEEVAARAVARVLAVDDPVVRLETACTLAPALPAEVRRPVYDELRAGALPPVMPDMANVSLRDVKERFVGTLPAEWQEEWIAAQLAALPVHQRDSSERGLRHRLARWPEDAVRRLWDGLDWRSGPAPVGLGAVVPGLPPDLRAETLARVRAAEGAVRWSELVGFGEELTDDELRAVVMSPRAAVAERNEVYALRAVIGLVPRVPGAAEEWLARAFAMEEEWSRQAALITLAPVLFGDAQRRAVDEIVSAGLRDGLFCYGPPWALLPAEVLPAVVARLAEEEGGGWQADEAIAHVIHARPELADGCLRPVLTTLGGRAPDRCLELLTAMTPWLARAEPGFVAQAAALVDAGPWSAAPDRWYRVQRMYRVGQ